MGSKDNENILIVGLCQTLKGREIDLLANTLNYYHHYYYYNYYNL